MLCVLTIWELMWFKSTLEGNQVAETSMKLFWITMVFLVENIEIAGINLNVELKVSLTIP